ncbi:MAG TPA: hypothetical protein VGL99_25525, partial [Chloroflexota bacterium]
MKRYHAAGGDGDASAATTDVGTGADAHPGGTQAHATHHFRDQPVGRPGRPPPPGGGSGISKPPPNFSRWLPDLTISSFSCTPNPAAVSGFVSCTLGVTNQGVFDATGRVCTGQAAGTIGGGSTATITITVRGSEQRWRAQRVGGGRS